MKDLVFLLLGLGGFVCFSGLISIKYVFVSEFLSNTSKNKSGNIFLSYLLSGQNIL